MIYAEIAHESAYVDWVRRKIRSLLRRNFEVPIVNLTETSPI